MLRRLALPLAGLVFLSGLVGASPAAAAEAPPYSVTMFSDPGDYIGQGVPRLFDDRNSKLYVAGNRTEVIVRVDGGTRGDDFELYLAGPAGTVLTRGLYERAERTSFRSAGRPGIDISGSGRGCNATSGRFEIRDITFDAAGVVSRLHLLYEQHCEGEVPALFGEIQLRRSAAAGVLAEPSSVSWPDTHPTSASTTVPVTLRALGASPVSVTSVRVTGTQATHFMVPNDECTGVVLEAGDLCDVFVRFVPRLAGPRTAVLAITDSAGRTQRVQLDGAGVTGRTSWSMRGDAGDWVSQGLSYSYTPANAVIAASGARSGVRAAVQGRNGDWFYANFTPADGHILAVGTYTGATRYPFNGTGPGLSVTGNGRGCNRLTGSFTIKQIGFSRLDGSLERLNVDFIQRCDGATAALRGSIAYRASADVTPPARVSRVTATPVAGGVRLSWTNPVADWSRTVVRRLDGSVPPGSPTTAHATYSGTVTSVTVTGLPTGSTHTFSLWTVDPVGNAGRPVTVLVKAG